MTPPVALFETMRVRGGRLPFVGRHERRLAQAARVVGLTPPPPLAAEARARAARGDAERVLRVVWDGARLAWEEREAPSSDPLKVVTVTQRHPGYPVKAVARDAFDSALADAAALGGDEPLLLTADGAIAETARCAIVWLDGEVLRVPDPALGVLPSVGLARLLELAAAREVPVYADWFPPEALEGRPAVLVNAVRGVVRISRLDDVEVPVAPVFTALATEFWPPA